MKHLTQNKLLKEYLDQVNQLTWRFIVFEEVSNEYVKTSKNIILGNGLVNENLQSLQSYFLRSLLSLEKAILQTIKIPVSEEYASSKDYLEKHLNQYIEATRNVIFNLSSHSIEIIMANREVQRNHKKQINKALINISKIKLPNPTSLKNIV